MSDDIDGTEIEAPQPVPYARFQESRSQLKAAKDELKQAAALIAEYKAKADGADTAHATAAETKAALAALQAEADARVESMQRDHLDTVALLRAGIHDDEGIAVARTLFGMQAEDARKPMPEWLASLREEGAVVPRPLQPYLAPPAPEKPATPKPPAPNGRAPSANGTATEASIRAARDKMRKTGDATDLKSLLGMA